MTNTSYDEKVDTSLLRKGFGSASGARTQLAEYHAAIVKCCREIDSLRIELKSARKEIDRLKWLHEEDGCANRIHREMMALKQELLNSPCPRPINTAIDESTKWCIENGECGCGRRVLLP